MVYTGHFATAVLGCYLTAYALVRANWTAASPRVAIVCWQALGLALGLSAIGIPISLGLSPYGESTGQALRALAGDLAVGTLAPGMSVGHLSLIGVGIGIASVLIGSTVASLRAALKARKRQRDLLTLVARADPKAPGALVLDHPTAAAYCVPGLRSRIVVSAGTLSLLDRAELAALLAHERAHARERHDLVLLPFTALCRALPGVRWIAEAYATVALLVEMRADDEARRRHADAPLAAALTRFRATPKFTPAGTLGATDGDLEARVRRLREPAKPTPFLGNCALAVAVTLAWLPISLFLS
jgi:Zn-dependent protease with chaperone function